MSGAAGKHGWCGSDGTEYANGSTGPGENGSDGGHGIDADDGTDAQNLALLLSLAEDGVHLAGCGLDGPLRTGLVVQARGGNGGNGGAGGSGGQGGEGRPNGKPGRDGRGGRGGHAGRGGQVSITAAHPHLLALVTGVDVRGGVGGAGGSGGPAGTDGNDGTDGTDGNVELAATNPETGVLEIDQQVGLVAGPDAVQLDDDGSRCGAHYTRSSQLWITGLRLENPSAVAMPAPFRLRFAAESPLELSDADAVEVETSVPGHGAVDLPIRVGIRVGETCDIGTFRVRVAAMAQVGGRHIHLHAGHEDVVLDFSVNHRLVLDEVATDAPGRAFLVTLVERLNGLDPASQISVYSAFALVPMLGEQAIDTNREAALEQMLAGQGFDASAFWSAFSAHQISAKDATKRQAALMAAAHLFAALPVDSRTKIMDSAWFLTSTDQVIGAEEKQRLKDLARGMGFDDAWLMQRLPRVMAPGASSVKAQRSNRMALWTLPVVMVLLTFAVRALIDGSADGAALKVASVFFGRAFDCGLFVAMAVLLTHPLRRLLFRKACRACEGIVLVPVARASDDGASMLGGADELRCTDCGARGRVADGTRSELFHADCPTAHAGGAGGGFQGGYPERRASLVVLALAVLAGLGSVGVRSEGSDLTEWLPALGLCGGLYAIFARAWMWRAHRMSGFTWAWLNVVSVSVVIGLTILALSR